MAQQELVLICDQVAESKLAPITGELLGAGRTLADELGGELGALLLGSAIEAAASQAIAFGADRVYLADNALFATYDTDLYTELATRVCRELAPSILLLGQTDVGRDLAPRLAARLNTGLSMDCVGVRIDPDSKLMVQARPVYGGNAFAEVVSKSRPQMATIRSRSMPSPEPDSSRQGRVIPVELGEGAPVGRTKVIERVKEEVGLRLEDAQVVVGGGRGIGGAEGFASLAELARLLGGAVGATRTACEEGWIATTLQIGQTGKIVSPELYIAVALSGAMQHLAGCSGSKNIVAINKDPEANIFKVARYGIVGDYRGAIPALIEKCKELLDR